MAPQTLGVLTTATSTARRSHPPVREHSDIGDSAQPTRALEIALMRRSLAGVSQHTERCGRCGRTMLTGERLYEYTSGEVRCALCRERERQMPAQSHTVHGPEFGHSIRVIDRRTGISSRSSRD